MRSISIITTRIIITIIITIIIIIIIIMIIIIITQCTDNISVVLSKTKKIKNKMQRRFLKIREVASVLTEHGHVLPCIEVPVAPVSPVAVQRCILLMIVSWLRPKCVNHTDVTPV